MDKQEDRKDVQDILRAYDQAADDAKSIILAFIDGYNFRKSLTETTP